MAAFLPNEALSAIFTHLLHDDLPARLSTDTIQIHSGGNQVIIVTSNPARNHRLQTLCACALTCKAWLAASRRVLYRSITIVPGDSFTRLHTTLHSNPTLGFYLHTLQIEPCANGIPASISDVLKAAPQLANLDITYELWRAAHVYSMPFYNTLKVLDMDAMDCHRYPTGDLFFAAPREVESLTIRGRWGKFVNAFLSRENTLRHVKHLSFLVDKRFNVLPPWWNASIREEESNDPQPGRQQSLPPMSRLLSLSIDHLRYHRRHSNRPDVGHREDQTLLTQLLVRLPQCLRSLTITSLHGADDMFCSVLHDLALSGIRLETLSYDTERHICQPVISRPIDIRQLPPTLKTIRLTSSLRGAREAPFTCGITTAFLEALQDPLFLPHLIDYPEVMWNIKCQSSGQLRNSQEGMRKLAKATASALGQRRELGVVADTDSDTNTPQRGRLVRVLPLPLSGWPFRPIMLDDDDSHMTSEVSE